MRATRCLSARGWIWTSSLRGVQTALPRGRSWHVASDDGDLALHFLLWLRDAAGVALPGGMDRTVPPALLIRPDPIDLSIDADSWLAWWTELLQWQPAPGDMWKWWQICPATLVEAIEPFRDPGLTWVQDNVKSAAERARRHHGLPLDDHVHTAVGRLQRELGNRLRTLDVSIHGLAVEGEWLRVEPSGSPILVSWAGMDRPESWLLDALRPAATAAAAAR